MTFWAPGFWSAGFWSSGFWGDLVEFPQYIVSKPLYDWGITEQVQRASHGMLHIALDRRRAIRRG